MSVQIKAKEVERGDVILVQGDKVEVVDIFVSKYSETVVFKMNNYPTCNYHPEEEIMVDKFNFRR